MQKKLLALVLALAMALSLPFQMPVMAEESVSGDAEEITCVTTSLSSVGNIEKYGNVILDLSIEDFLDAGFEFGDVVNVEFLGQTLELPVCSNYSDVDSGNAGLFARSSTEDTNIKLAINMGNFADTYGIATKTTNEDKTYYWTVKDGVKLPVDIEISMNEAGGYYDEYVMHNISYTDVRSDYADLSDEQFANFRNIATTGMGKNILYRSASPVNPGHNRNTYADAALKNAGVTVVMNLADDEATVKDYEGYADSYYATTKYIALNLGVDTAAADFKAGLGEGLKFFAENPGVYEVHCTEGKDRAGFVSAILESFMGATAEEVVADYMVTYYNYYGITADDARYSVIANSNIVKSLQNAFGVEDIYTADLQKCAEAYIKDAGLSDDEIAALKANLSADRVIDVEGEISGTESMEKYGHAKTNITKADFFAAGYEYGDIVTVTVNGQDIDMPFCSNYSDVDDGEVVLLARASENTIKLCINNHKFLETYGIATYSKDDAGNVVWTPCEGVTLPLSVKIVLKEAKGYLDQYNARNIEYTNDRNNYPGLTDEQFANFRNVTTTGIPAGILYRSSSPINPEIGRNTYADAAYKAAGVTVVMNLADTEEAAKAYEGYDQTYYSTTKYIALNMNLDVLSEDFKTQLAKGLKFFAENPGVYGVHCTEGKDRAGYVTALLECFMGASGEEVVEDYMTTYYNYYGITKNDATYMILANGNIVKNIQNTFGIDDIYTANLAACAEAYFKTLGLTDDEIAALRDNLSDGHTKTTIKNAKAATCLKTGYTGDTYCTICDKLLKKGETIAKLTHKTVVKNAKAATYLKTGYTGDTYCKVCGTLLKKGKTIAKLTPKTQKITVSTKASKTVYVSYKARKKSSYSFKISAKAKGTITYKQTYGSKKYIAVSKSGKVTIKKGVKKGTYKVTVYAAATKNGMYKKNTKTVKIVVR